LTVAARQSDWDGIVACHRGRLATTTWNYQRCTMGDHHLQPPREHRTGIATVTSDNIRRTLLIPMCEMLALQQLKETRH